VSTRNPSIGLELARLESHLANTFSPDVRAYQRFAGIIGDRPSQYAKSPSLWNAAFTALGLNAMFLPLDVDQPKLPDVVRVLRASERLLGFSVTVPYKVSILPLLDEVEEKASRIGAVNTVARMADGRLVGYNTDGSGFLASLTAPVVDRPLCDGSIAGMDVLLIGAGGAARAVAFFLADQIAPGRLFLANRTDAAGQDVARAVNAAYGNAIAVGEEQIGELAGRVGLIVNGSTKGQAGLRRLADERVVMLEPYSALAPATPAPVPAGLDPASDEARRRWFEASRPDIEQNNRRSLEIAAHAPAATAAYDLVYAPTETVFLRHLRYSGHRTANGKGMNIAQAVDAFCDRVCAEYLRDSGFEATAVRRRVTEEMSRVW